MRPARLKLYYNYLRSFDLIDKELRISSSLLITLEPSVLKIKTSLEQYQLDKDIIKKSLLLEITGKQRFLISKSKQIFFRDLFFKSTLRNDNLFFFFDTCLNTIFLRKCKFSTLDNIKFDNKLHFYWRSDSINYFALTSSKFNYFIQLPNSITCWKKI